MNSYRILELITTALFVFFMAKGLFKGAHELHELFVCVYLLILATGYGLRAEIIKDKQ